MGRTEEATLLLKIKTVGQNAMENLKKIGIAAISGITVAAGFSIKAFADYEKALIGVGKTADISGAELRNLGIDLQKLSGRLPNSTNELLEIAQAAGQLGVKGSGNIVKFTETMAKLASASDVVGEEGSKAVARLLEITGEGIKTVDQFSAALVDLGNNAAASESEILTTATRVGSSTARFGTSSAQILGMSAALTSLGQQSEISGSVVGRSFDAIDQSIRAGGANFLELQRITGMTGDQLRKTFKEDSTEVFRAFIKGLSEANSRGENTSKILEDMDLSGVRVNQVIGVLTQNYGVLEKNITRANKAYSDNTALNEEAARAAQGIGAQMSMARNLFINLSVALGERLAPSVRFVVDEFKNFMSNGTQLEEFLNGITSIFQFLTKSGIAVKTSFQLIGSELGALASAGVQFIQGNFSNAIDVLKSQNDKITQIFNDSANQWTEIDKKFTEDKKLRDESEKLRQIQKEKEKADKLSQILEEANRKKLDQQNALDEEMKAKAQEVDDFNAERELNKQELELSIKTAHEQQLLQVKLDRLNQEIKAQDDATKKLSLINQRDLLQKKKDEAAKTALEREADSQRIQNRSSTLSKIASLSSSSNKALAIAGKAAGLTQIAIETPIAISKALSSAPPPFNFALAAGVGAAMAQQTARLTGVALAEGGIIPKTPGGIQATIGEGGRDEAVIPLPDDFDPDKGLNSGNTFIFNGPLLGDREEAREFAKAIDQQLLELRRNNESVSFDEDLI